MADEIKYGFKVTVNNGNLQLSFSENSTADQSDVDIFSTVFDVPTSYTALDIDLNGTEGWVMVRNLDANNFVELGVETAVATFSPVVVLDPGDVQIFRLSPGPPLGGGYYAQADTSSVSLEFRVYAD